MFLHNTYCAHVLRNYSVPCMYVACHIYHLSCCVKYRAIVYNIVCRHDHEIDYAKLNFFAWRRGNTTPTRKRKAAGHARTVINYYGRFLYVAYAGDRHY